MKYLSKIYYLTVWAVLFVPALVKAWSPGDPVVPCGTSINTDACEFSHIIKLIDNILDIFIWLAVLSRRFCSRGLVGFLFIAETSQGQEMMQKRN